MPDLNQSGLTGLKALYRDVDEVLIDLEDRRCVRSQAHKRIRKAVAKRLREYATHPQITQMGHDAIVSVANNIGGQD